LVVVVVLIPEVYRVIRIGSKLDFVHFSAVVTARRWAAAKGSKRGIADCDAINPLSQLTADLMVTLFGCPSDAVIAKKVRGRQYPQSMYGITTGCKSTAEMDKV
jgi:hypothetical protein